MQRRQHVGNKAEFRNRPPVGRDMTNWNWRDDQDMGPPLHLMGRPIIFDGNAGDGYSESNLIRASIQVCSTRKNYDPGQDRDIPKGGYKCEFLYLGYPTKRQGGGARQPPTTPL